MSRLAERFRARAGEGRSALIPYITAGDPSPEITVDLMHALVDAGADVLELGVPFSDPMADGPVVQAACERALAQGVTLRGVLDMARAFRRRDTHTPLVLMGYMNPIEAMGWDSFAAAAAAAGVDGVLVVDLTAEEAPDVAPVLAAAGLDPVFLVAPTTPEARLAAIAANAAGFLYYVSLKGVTGAANLDAASLEARLALVRKYSRLPLAVGFGIRDAQAAAAVARCADAVVVGSALVARAAALAGDDAALLAGVAALVAEMRAAMDAAVTSAPSGKTRQSA